MKKITAGNLVKWNGAEQTLDEFIEHLEELPHLDTRFAKLLSDLIVAHNNFVSSDEDDTEV